MHIDSEIKAKQLEFHNVDKKDVLIHMEPRDLKQKETS